MKRLKDYSGVTLIEMIIGIVISMVIMGAMYASYTAINSSYSQVTDKAKASQIGRNVLGMMIKDLRQAGFKVFEDNLRNNDESVSIIPNQGGVNADVVSDCDHIRIVYGDATLDANQEEVYERYRVTYFCRPSQLLDPDGNLEATNTIFKQKEEWVNNGWVTNGNNSYPPQLITDYVEDLILIPKDENGFEIDPPPEARNANRLRFDDIRAVEIALETRSRNNFYNTTTRNDGTDRTIFNIDDNDETTINDLFLREITVLSVSTRNVGLE